MYKVAVVEDEVLESEAICRMVREIGENWKVVAVAHSGLEAISKINESDPDIVLLDIKIPEMDGLQVLKHLKEENPNRNVIIITAYNEFDYAHKAIQYRVDDFLLKPIRPNQLRDSLKRVLSEINNKRSTDLDVYANDIFFHIVNRRYSDTKNSLHKYVENLYIFHERNLDKIQAEVLSFIDRLADNTSDLYTLPVVELETKFKAHPKVFQNPYQLFQELKKIIDGIFDYILENENDTGSMDRILNYIDRNCHKDISLNQVGRYANMSSYYLSKIFKKETGVNFVTYLTDRKIELAKDMLEHTDIPIINIALELSYHEPNYFSKVFKKSTGMTPTEYRRYKKTRI